MASIFLSFLFSTVVGPFLSVLFYPMSCCWLVVVEHETVEPYERADERKEWTDRKSSSKEISHKNTAFPTSHLFSKPFRTLSLITGSFLGQCSSGDVAWVSSWYMILRLWVQDHRTGRNHLGPTHRKIPKIISQIQKRFLLRSLMVINKRKGEKEKERRKKRESKIKIQIRRK